MHSNFHACQQLPQGAASADGSALISSWVDLIIDNLQAIKQLECMKMDIKHHQTNNLLISDWNWGAWVDPCWSPKAPKIPNSSQNLRSFKGSRLFDIRFGISSSFLLLLIIDVSYPSCDVGRHIPRWFLGSRLPQGSSWWFVTHPIVLVGSPRELIILRVPVAWI